MYSEKGGTSGYNDVFTQKETDLIECTRQKTSMNEILSKIDAKFEKARAIEVAVLMSDHQSEIEINED